MFIFSVEQKVIHLKNIEYSVCEDCCKSSYDLYEIRDIFRPFYIFKIALKKKYILKCCNCSVTYTLSKSEFKKLSSL